ncbi:adenine phosphoribosyltransferase [Antrihabitans spumae]|uniref:Adenine phosphoribosyltransferase n=1 Tax=Antrihabitans spumae TaxID=3373370 RepID=A0ABW7JZN5_9NOCA
MTESAAQAVERLTRWAPDFPVPGVRFADLTPVFADAAGFDALVRPLAELAPDADVVAGIDARGFLIGGAVAVAKRCGVLAVRKSGKLPPPVIARQYALEYGTATLEIPADGVDLRGRKVLLLDDVLATGGTLVAAAELLTDAGAEVVALAVVLELNALAGREKVERELPSMPLRSLVQI